jgi:K+-transporting ATPase ATPase A chain
VSAQGWLQIAVYLGVLTALTPPLGAYMARVYQGEPLALERVLGPLERLVYRMLGPAAGTEQDWKAYARTTIVFSAVFFVVLYTVLRTQGIHPLNPEGFDSGTWDLSFNTTASFITNTNWQYYGGETTLSYFSQMAGLTVQNFVSAAVGMAVLAAVIRGFVSRGSAELGNFWRDLTRSLLYILLPLSFAGALVLVSQGAIQTLSGSVSFPTVTGVEQTLALGPGASQISIKQLGTNGGGFFNVNSSYPFENPTQFSNFVEMLFILLIPAGLTATFGRLVGNRRQGWSIYAAMLIMLAVTIGVGYAAESNGSPAQRAAGIEVDAGASDSDVNVADADQQTGGNLEGKEQRNGLSASTTWAAATTAASNGSVNSALDSYTGIGGLAPLFNVITGEVIFGGVGSGLYGMLLFVLLAVFIAGLMVGRTPEYLGKKIEAREVKLVMVGTLVVPLIVLTATAIAISSKYGDPSIYNPGPQGFSETLYAYASQANNNGSALAGYTGYVQPNAPGNVGAYGITFADLLGGVAMLFGRFVPMLAALAVAGSLAGKRVSPPGPGTFRTDNPTFVLLLIVVVVLVAALTFFPAALLGPIVQGLSDSLTFPK